MLSAVPGSKRIVGAVVLAFLSLRPLPAAEGPPGAPVGAGFETSPGPSGQTAYLGAEGKPLPYQSEREVLEALRTARIVSRKRISEGINGVLKVLLEKDGVRMHAAFRDVDVFKQRHRRADGMIRFNFKDSCVFELAAYRVARLLGLDNVPPVVKRRIGRRKGTLQLWIEDAIMDKERRNERLRPAQDMMRWRRQWNTLYLFDYLIANDDRNQGNILFDKDWKMWMIDHTRAFRRMYDSRRIKRIRLCPRKLHDALQELERADLEEALGDLLSTQEVKTLFQRRGELLRHIEELVERKGAELVLR